MKSPAVEVLVERDRPLNTISLNHAVLCANCDVVSDSPHDECLVCGSRSLFNISRLLGGMLPSRRATLLDAEAQPATVTIPVLEFPRPHRIHARRQLRLFRAASTASSAADQQR